MGKLTREHVPEANTGETIKLRVGQTGEKVLPRFGQVEKATVDNRCAHFQDGLRCPHYGTMSRTPQGHGPWYCSQHFWTSEN